MKYKKNQYFFENIKVTNIARKFGTPIYCYSYNKLKRLFDQNKYLYSAIILAIIVTTAAILY